MVATGQINAINTILTFDNGLTNNGSLNLINTTVAGAVSSQSTVNLAGINNFTGDVRGTGNYAGSGTAVFQGSFSPGTSPGEVDFGGNVEAMDTNTMMIELGGTTAGSQYDRLTIAGSALLDGTLEVSIIDGFLPTLGSTFEFLTSAGGVSGTFSSVSLPNLEAA